MRLLLTSLLLGCLSVGAACGGGKELGEPCDLTAEGADLCLSGLCVAIISCKNGNPPRHKAVCAEQSCTLQNTCRSGLEPFFNPTRDCYCVPSSVCN